MSLVYGFLSLCSYTSRSFSCLLAHLLSSIKTSIHMHFCNITICKSMINSAFHTSVWVGVFCQLLCITTLYYLTKLQYYIGSQADFFLFQIFFKKKLNPSPDRWGWDMSEICVKMFSKWRDLQRNATTGVNYFLSSMSMKNFKPRVSLKNCLSSYFKIHFHNRNQVSGQKKIFREKLEWPKLKESLICLLP